MTKLIGYIVKLNLYALTQPPFNAPIKGELEKPFKLKKDLFEGIKEIRVETDLMEDGKKIITSLPFKQSKPEYNAGIPTDLLKTEVMVDIDVSKLNWDIGDFGKLDKIITKVEDEQGQTVCIEPEWVDVATILLADAMGHPKPTAT